MLVKHNECHYVQFVKPSEKIKDDGKIPTYRRRSAIPKENEIPTFEVSASA